MELDRVGDEPDRDRDDAGDAVGNDAGALRARSTAELVHQLLLQQLAGCQVANQAAIGGEKLVVGQFFEPDPAHLVVDLVVDFAA